MYIYVFAVYFYYSFVFVLFIYLFIYHCCSRISLDHPPPRHSSSSSSFLFLITPSPPPPTSILLRIIIILMLPLLRSLLPSRTVLSRLPVMVVHVLRTDPVPSGELALGWECGAVVREGRMKQARGTTDVCVFQCSPLRPRASIGDGSATTSTLLHLLGRSCAGNGA